MWIALLLFASLLFAAAALISPIIWFFIPAIGLLALTIALAAGMIGAGQEQPDDSVAHKREREQASGDERVKGYAHPGQAPGHSA